MMLFLAIATLIAAIGLGVLIAFANGMSDAPTAAGASFRPAWIALAVSIALFVCWHFGWHPSW